MGNKADYTISVVVVGKNPYSSNLDMCLTARALGASEITFIGRKDTKLIRYINKLNRNWGGKFRVSYSDNYKDTISSATKYKKVYLTRFGMPLHKLTYTLKTYKNIMLILAVKDSFEPLNRYADFNVSITDQPHCGAAAIAVFLHDFYEGRELAMHFENAKYKLVQNEQGVVMRKVSA